MSDPTPVAQKKYMLAQALYEVPYFAEGPGGYGDCPDLKRLEVTHKTCRARVSGGVLTRVYAGLVDVGDARASALRRRCGATTYAYMKGTVAEYEAVKVSDKWVDWDGTGLNTLKGVIKFSKRLDGHPAYNLHVLINSTGGRGYVKRIDGGGTYYQSLNFDEPIGVHHEHEWWLTLEAGDYALYWITEFLGTTYNAYYEYPGSTPA